MQQMLVILDAKKIAQNKRGRIIRQAVSDKQRHPKDGAQDGARAPAGRLRDARRLRRHARGADGAGRLLLVITIIISITITCFIIIITSTIITISSITITTTVLSIALQILVLFIMFIIIIIMATIIIVIIIAIRRAAPGAQPGPEGGRGSDRRGAQQPQTIMQCYVYGTQYT